MAKDGNLQGAAEALGELEKEISRLSSEISGLARGDHMQQPSGNGSSDSAG